MMDDFTIQRRKNDLETLALMSDCSRRGVSAVITTQWGAPVSTGFNGMAAIFGKSCKDGYCPRCANPDIPSGVALETCLCVHAEARAITRAARLGQSLDGCAIFCSHRPCMDCFKLIVSAGIYTVMFVNDYPGTYTTPEHVKFTKI